LLSGDITITRFGMTPRFDFALYLARSRQPVAVPDPTSVLNNIRLDVRVTSAPELQFQTSVARLSGDVDLRIRGTAARPAVLGRVTLAEGDISFNGTTYHLEHGDVTFTSPVGIEPVVNVTATARVREYDITLGFHGPANRMSTTYRSEPPLPVGDIIALLAFGRTREDAALQSQQSPQSITETASNAILGQALNATLSQRAQRLFGISRIKIDPQVGGPEANPNARVTIEQQVSNWVTLTYITNLARSAEQIIQAEFIVNQNVSLLAVRDQNGVVGFDVRVRHRRR
jgi:translocation and assembly module TamB